VNDNSDRRRWQRLLSESLTRVASETNVKHLPHHARGGSKRPATNDWQCSRCKASGCGMNPDELKQCDDCVSQDFDFLQSIAVNILAAPSAPQILAAKGPLAHLCLAGKTAVKAPPALSSQKRCTHRRQREHSTLRSKAI